MCLQGLSVLSRPRPALRRRYVGHSEFQETAFLRRHGSRNSELSYAIGLSFCHSRPTAEAKYPDVTIELALGNCIKYTFSACAMGSQRENDDIDFRLGPASG